MDALGLQAALVKLDPATTVTPIGSNVKMLPSRHRTSYEVDETDLTLRNVLNLREDEKSHHHHHHHHRHNHHPKTAGGANTEAPSGQSTFRKLQIGNNEIVSGGITSSNVTAVLPSGTNGHHRNNHKNLSSSSSSSSAQKIVTTKSTMAEVR